MSFWLQRSHVPQFGNWEGQENVPYTVYFEKARKGRKGEKMINPNDPEENPDLYSDNDSQLQSSSSGGVKEPIRQPDARPEQKRNSEDKDMKPQVDSNGPNGVPSSQGNKRSSGASIGSQNSFEHSPLHPQAKVPARGIGAPSPVWEAKSSYGSIQGTPGRSRTKPATRPNDSVRFLPYMLSCICWGWHKLGKS